MIYRPGGHSGFIHISRTDKDPSEFFTRRHLRSCDLRWGHCRCRLDFACDHRSRDACIQKRYSLAFASHGFFSRASTSPCGVVCFEALTALHGNRGCNGSYPFSFRLKMCVRHTVAGHATRRIRPASSFSRMRTFDRILSDTSAP